MKGVPDAFLKVLADAPFNILGNGAAFFLGKGSKKRQHELTIFGEGVDFFLLKPNFNSYGFQLPYCLQEINGVSCKT